MANTDLIKSLPYPGSGLSVTASASAWVFGGYQLLSDRTAYDIAVMGLRFQVTNIPGAGTTTQYLFEIATGYSGKELPLIQIPYACRMDTTVGYYLTQCLNVFLPEPVFVPAGSRLTVRVANSMASATAYNGVKLLYQIASGVIEQRTGLSNNYQFVRAGDGMSCSERIR
jgi:hypothetical protein